MPAQPLAQPALLGSAAGEQEVEARVALARREEDVPREVSFEEIG